jgi:tryptophan-rich sensory protein
MWSIWSILALVVAVAIPIGVGFLGNLAGGGGVDEWYRNLNKPSWTPPDLAFPIIWTTLYILMGISSWLVWKEGGLKLTYSFIPFVLLVSWKTMLWIVF